MATYRSIPFDPSQLGYFHRRYSVFTINVPLAVRFAMAAISMRKTESPEYGRFDQDFH